jgi:hypothetical protein
MPVDERRRSQLFEAVARALGPEHADTMFELLPSPSTDLATRADIEALRAEMNQRLADHDARFDRLDQRFEAIGQRFDDQRDFLEARLDGLRDELLAAFRGELVSAVSGQTRAVIVAVAVAVFGIGGLAVTIAQVL